MKSYHSAGILEKGVAPKERVGV